MKYSSLPSLPLSLKNDLIFLRPIQASDRDTLYTVASDPEIWTLHPEPLRYQREVFNGYFDGAFASGTAFLVFEKATGDLIGCSRYYHYDALSSSIAIGYTFLAQSLGRKV